MVVENSFGRLKGRWRCLLKRIDSHVSNVPNTIAASVVLHNMCEVYGDHCLHEWIISENSSSTSSNLPTSVATTNTATSSIQDAIRDSL